MWHGSFGSRLSERRDSAKGDPKPTRLLLSEDLASAHALSLHRKSLTETSYQTSTISFRLFIRQQERHPSDIPTGDEAPLKGRETECKFWVGQPSCAKEITSFSLTSSSQKIEYSSLSLFRGRVSILQAGQRVKATVCATRLFLSPKQPAEETGKTYTGTRLSAHLRRTME